ncbi:biopolymer transporter ExbD [Pseudonocardia sp. TMWB2A]|uniref:ExbD/TolR family protein n=1 Tax=Pseudonocardia sp. TMWB2A TaxID=687430 RepID=UPI00307E302F
MAMSMGGGGDEAPMGEMNTTPLIDVMLVLLVMFIITIPIQTHAVKVDLPVPDNTPKTDNIDPIKNKLTIDINGQLAWNGEPVDQTALAAKLEATKAIQPMPELQFQPDPNARYVIVDETLATIKRSDVGKLGFVGNEQYGREF